MRVEFDQPVVVALGKPGTSRKVTTVMEAIYCIRHEKWPRAPGAILRNACRLLDEARMGNVAPSEARKAFSDAAEEANILVNRS
ncbi:DUF982 domain-containing protein [Aminobacter aganoensis]|uniref:DUF982 domain-containing protein n=1 Tax=Aminobacter aganoensis TaxID=83264 RepID=UPI0009E7BC72